MPKELKELQDQFEAFLTATNEARAESSIDRDYDDHIQWTAEEINELEARNQPPVVINRYKNKANLLSGIQRRMRTKPRALPRTPNHEGAADAITEALRFVVDNTDFQVTSSDVFRNGEVVWGYGAVITEVAEKGDEFEIVVNEIEPDRYFFDPHSSKRDFSDKTYDGITIWMDADAAKEMFPGMEEEIDAGFDAGSDNTSGTEFEDKPLWFDTKRKRVRINQHYYKEKGKWYVAFYTGADFLRKPEESPYLDEDGNPANPIEAQAAYVDGDNNRYGEARSWRWLQDEINHRRSKLLYLMSVRQTIGEEGAVKDVNRLKQELAKADGHVTKNPGMELEIVPTADIAASQFQIYQESKMELDSLGQGLLAGNSPQELSGRAVQLLQQGGASQLAPLFDGHKHWEKRVYRQIYARIKQFWGAEKWIRVTDNEQDLKWVGLNQPMTFGEQLREAAQQGSQEAAQALQFGIANQDPRLNQVVEVRNPVSELDVDIILTESPDFITIRQEQFEILAELAKAYGPQAVPFEVMLELSEIPRKEGVKACCRATRSRRRPLPSCRAWYSVLALRRRNWRTRKPPLTLRRSRLKPPSPRRRFSLSGCRAKSPTRLPTRMSM